MEPGRERLDGTEGVRVRCAGADITGTELLLWEVQFARRALALLKSVIPPDRMVELLAPLTARSAELFAGWRAASEGRMRSITVEIDIDGLSSARFGSWFRSHAGGPAALAGHPEHFLFSEDGGAVSLIETMGWYPVHLVVTPQSEDQSLGPVDPEYPTRVIGSGHPYGHDGTGGYGGVLHQFKDTATGCRAALQCFFPASTPDEYVAIHRRHLALEFSNWLVAAREDSGQA